MTQVMGNGNFCYCYLDPCTVLAEANLHSANSPRQTVQKMTKGSVGGISQIWRLRDL